MINLCIVIIFLTEATTHKSPHQPEEDDTQKKETLTLISDSVKTVQL